MLAEAIKNRNYGLPTFGAKQRRAEGGVPKLPKRLIALAEAVAGPESAEALGAWAWELPASWPAQ